ncbi:AAA family ATPase [Sediminibacterium ginsengisoli]|uniref:AAA domain-containing protein, putative AbiEii toxin, Type IV TA system n=1 Tax=Sediminibacterium ginsengisoli TaxID=413434 RepID=A0A1T4M5S1_9BACT|nr:AAA family ATPase [Sediminibacterium ginsengisoli]SJZ62272.1 AAA domain-containing protein, putative AbiEii toxin, Type IV TA system [Sediminibacterium ginsengisoli]
MELKKIKLSGFANIESIDIELGKLNALVALNNYGKSNVLDAIEFGIDFIIQPLPVKSRMMAYRPVIPINSHIDKLPFSFEVGINSNFQNEEHSIVYGFSFEWIKNDKGKGQKIKEEYLKVKSNKVDSKYKTILNRNLEKTLYLSSQTGRCDKILKVQKNELAINKLLNFDDLFYWDVIKAINTLSIAQVDTLQNPDGIFGSIVIKGKEDDIVKNDYSVSLGETSNAGFFIYSLMKRNPSTYELFKDSVKTLLPSIEDFEPIEIDLKSSVTFKNEKPKIPLDFPEKLYDIRVKETNTNQQTSIGRLSSGSQKLFYVLALTIAAEHNKTPLITFEELENSIHPGLLQKLLIIIDGLTDKTKVLLSSHSPYLVQYLDINKIKIGLPNSKGLAVFKEIKKTKFTKVITIAEEEGISVGDVIFDKMIESASGESDLLNELCK